MTSELSANRGAKNVELGGSNSASHDVLAPLARLLARQAARELIECEQGARPNHRTASPAEEQT